MKYILKATNDKPKRVSMPPLTKKQKAWNQKARDTVKRISQRYSGTLPLPEKVIYKPWPTYEDVKDA